MQGLATELRENNYNLKPVLRTLFLSRAFYSKEAMGTQVKSPVQFMVRVAHDLDTEPVPYAAMARFTAQLGQDLLYPPNVKGWHGGKALRESFREYMRSLEPAKRRSIRAQMSESSSPKERQAIMQAALDGHPMEAA